MTLSCLCKLRIPHLSSMSLTHTISQYFYCIYIYLYILTHIYAWYLLSSSAYCISYNVYSSSNIFMYIIRAANYEQMRILYTWIFVYIVTAVKYSTKLIGFVVFSCNSLIQALVGKSRALSLFPFEVYCTCCGWAIHTQTVHDVCFSSCHTRFFLQCVCGAACMRYGVGSADDKTAPYIYYM